MNLHYILLPLITLFSIGGCASATVAEPIANAHYANPVERYNHFALGRPHEYATLTATMRSGRTLTLQLPGDEVFEDLVPRLVKLTANGPQAILTIVSQIDSGARLVLIQPQHGILAISAQSSAIGTPNRWLNPVAVADLDGDGRAEISAVITPHIGGTLKIYRKNGKRLIEVASLGGFSNHVYGTTELRLSISFSVSGRTYLLVPDTTRMALRIIALKNDRLVEAGRCALPAPITGPIKSISPLKVSVVTLGGIHTISPSRCLKQAT